VHSQPSRDAQPVYSEPRIGLVFEAGWVSVMLGQSARARGGAEPSPKGAIGDGSVTNATTAFSPRRRANGIANCAASAGKLNLLCYDLSKRLFVRPSSGIVCI